jgi:hypothetical protein
MSEDERNLFAGILDASSINGLADILKLTDQTSDYTLLPEASSDVALGKYMVAHGFLNCPESIKPYLDFDAIGTQFYSETSGAYTSDGYVVRKEELPHFLQKQAELEQGRDECREQIIQMKLEVRGQKCLLVLPDDSEHLDQMRGNLEISDFAEAKINDIAFSVPYLADLIPTDAISVEGTNEMAEYIEDMLSQDGALLKFCSVLEAEEPDNFPAALALAQNLDDYERVLDDTEEYGKAVLTHIGADDEIISTIDGYTDFDALGRDMMAEDGVLRTQFGLIRRLSAPFQEEAPGQVMT